MSTELSQIDDQPTSVLPAAPNTPSSDAVAMLMQHAQAMQTAHQLAVALCGTSMVPAVYRGKPEEGAAAILYGAELGLNPVQSLQQIFNVQGKPAIYARTMVALVKAKGYMIQTVSSDDTAVTVAGKDPRTGVQEQSTWTIDRAKKAGYTSNKKYDSDPQAMLYAKAATEVCRKLAPEVLLGITYSAEELILEEKPVAPAAVTKPGQTGLAGLKAELAAKRETTEPPAPDMVTADQMKQIAALLKNDGIATKKATLEWLSERVGRTVTAGTELYRREGDALIEFLSMPQAEPDPDPAPTLDRDSLEAAVLTAADNAGITDLDAWLSERMGQPVGGLGDLTTESLTESLNALAAQQKEK